MWVPLPRVVDVAAVVAVGAVPSAVDAEPLTGAPGPVPGGPVGAVGPVGVVDEEVVLRAHHLVRALLALVRLLLKLKSFFFIVQ